MAILVFENPQIIINSVDLSNHVDTVSLEISVADVETTAFGQVAKTRIGGLQDNKVSIELQQDFAAGSVEATIYPLIGLTTTIVLNEINAGTTTAGVTTNPTYTFVALVTDWKPLDGKVGDLQKASITWPISGAITKTV
jgi:hypothetical protein